ncbi:serine hydrolase domain-containing protein [Microlunatus sp. GCM10028923]|uniref:serine hydrolase domain-containing protein n=1 Tax=Microlunatus sp. GCM10028923 TaxID=3273400 RepID=UPI003622401C
MRDDAMRRLLEQAEAADTTQLLLAQGTKVLATIGDGGRPISTMSVTKLVVGLIIGRAVRLGLLDLDRPVRTWFPEWREGLKAKITVRHVMGHVSGLAADTWPQLNAAPPDDYVAYVIKEHPLAAEPGTVQAYNNAAVSVLPAIITRAAGKPFLDFAATELFRPLGIEDWTWGTDAAGNPFGMASAAFTAADLATLGELMIDNGRGGDRLLPAGWVDACRRPPIPGARAGLLLLQRWPHQDPDRTGDPFAYGHDGSEGQYLYAYPRSGLVVARLRDCGLSEGRFDPSTPEQVFQELPWLGAEVDAALAAD